MERDDTFGVAVCQECELWLITNARSSVSVASAIAESPM
jgi:hypothetical protein